MKILKKIFLFLFLLSFFVVNTFAFDANISVDKNNISLNDYFNLQIKVESSEPGEIKIEKISGIKNFSILGQSQSQSSSIQTIIVNGQAETKNTTIINLNLTLKAKSPGEYEIGPVILEKNNQKFNTNSIKIKVEKKGIFLNQTGTNIQNNINKQINNSQFSNNKKQVPNKEKIEDFEKSVEKKNFENNNKIFTLFIFLILIGILSLVYFRQKKEEEKEFENKKIVQKNNILEENIEEDVNDKEIIDYEKEFDINDNIEENDKDFCEKIDKIFRKKISKLYKIKNIDKKTYDEIIKEVGNDDKIKNIVEQLNKLKYSNIIGDKQKILELVKNF